MLPQLTITPAAEKFIRRVVRYSGLPDGAGLRLVVSSGGCSGYNAEFSAEAAPRVGEETLEFNGLRIFLPAESRLMLDGVTMDFADTPTQSGLTFTNPRQGTCACSSSTQAAPPGTTRIDVSAIGRGRAPTPGLPH